MAVIDWQCSFCSRDVTVGDANIHTDSTRCVKGSYDGTLQLDTTFIVCPSKACKKTSIKVLLRKMNWDKDTQSWSYGATVLTRDLAPTSRAQALPKYIPAAIVTDYNESCLIEDLSPKASATLSRRCLQGILRDYWKVKPGRLYDEIEEVKDKMDPDTWEAIDAVRKVGNIGAHMEKDINVIVDVEPAEAALLIGLIETLINDWYVVREARSARLKQIKDLAAAKVPKKASA